MKECEVYIYSMLQIFLGDRHNLGGINLLSALSSRDHQSAIGFRGWGDPFPRINGYVQSFKLCIAPSSFLSLQYVRSAKIYDPQPSSTSSTC